MWFPSNRFGSHVCLVTFRNAVALCLDIYSWTRNWLHSYEPQFFCQLFGAMKSKVEWKLGPGDLLPLIYIFHSVVDLKLDLCISTSVHLNFTAYPIHVLWCSKNLSMKVLLNLLKYAVDIFRYDDSISRIYPGESVTPLVRGIFGCLQIFVCVKNYKYQSVPILTLFLTWVFSFMTWILFRCCCIINNHPHNDWIENWGSLVTILLCTEHVAELSTINCALLSSERQCFYFTTVGMTLRLKSSFQHLLISTPCCLFNTAIVLVLFVWLRQAV